MWRSTTTRCCSCARAKFESAIAPLRTILEFQAATPDLEVACGLVLLRRAVSPADVPPRERELVSQAGSAYCVHLARHPEDAVRRFEALVSRHPDERYLRYGWGLALAQQGSAAVARPLPPGDRALPRRRARAAWSSGSGCSPAAATPRPSRRHGTRRGSLPASSRRTWCSAALSPGSAILRRASASWRPPRRWRRGSPRSSWLWHGRTRKPAAAPTPRERGPRSSRSRPARRPASGRDSSADGGTVGAGHLGRRAVIDFEVGSEVEGRVRVGLLTIEGVAVRERDAALDAEVDRLCASLDSGTATGGAPRCRGGGRADALQGDRHRSHRRPGRRTRRFCDGL